MNARDLKPYWVFIAGLVLLLIFTMLVVPARHATGYRPDLRRRILPGMTRHLLYEGFSSSDATFYMFGVDWCPHCVSAKPIFESMGSTVTIGGSSVGLQVINPEKDPRAAEGFEISGYPTFYLKKADGSKVKYSGSRTKQGFQDFLAQQLA